MHPATQCWCGHALSAHADRHRRTIGACRHVDTLNVRHFDGIIDIDSDSHRGKVSMHRLDDTGMLPRCPCTTFREVDDPIPFGQLTSVLEGLHIHITSLVGAVNGTIRQIDHRDGLTTITFTDTTHGTWQSHQFTARDDIPCTILIDWTDP